MADSINYLRGALIAYPPGGSMAASAPGGYANSKRLIPFRFNPEGLTRQISIEQGQGGGIGTQVSAGVGGARPGSSNTATAGSSQQATEQGADASAGSRKERFSILIRVDFADRIEAVNQLPNELGIAPELAALDELLYPADTASQAPSDGTEPTRARPQRWTVLFVWGRKRVVPIRITGMTINETMHNAQLNPVRAEIEVLAEVLGDADARDNAIVAAALAFTASNRRQLAQSFFDKTASQSTTILPI